MAQPQALSRPLPAAAPTVPPRGQALWALADQGLVSAANFATGLLVARALGPQGFGTFVLLWSVTLYANLVAGALVLAPMLGRLPAVLDPAERHRLLRGYLALQLWMGLGLAALIGVGGALVAAWRPGLVPPGAVAALAACTACCQAQDWLRRRYFAAGSSHRALGNDLLAYGGQLGVLALLALAGGVGVTAVLWAIAATSGAALAVGLLQERLWPAWRSAGEAFRHGEGQGWHLLWAGQLHWASSQGVLIIGACLIGSQATGGIRAVGNLLGPLSMMLQLLENVGVPLAARQYALLGPHGLVACVRSLALGCGLVLAPVLALVAAMAGPVMAWVYGPDFVRYAPLVGLQTLVVAAAFACQLLAVYHRAAGTTAAIAWGTALAAACAPLLAAILSGPCREAGVLWATLAGQLAYLGAMGVAARRHARRTA